MQDNSPLQILIPTDFSPAAEKALDFAIAIAQRTKAKLLVLHVYLIPFLPVRGAHFTDTEKGKENMAIAETRLNELIKNVKGAEEIGIEVKASPMYGAIEIPEIIRFQSADMIIMGTRRSGTLSKFLLGTNSANVVENAVCPVLVIPEEASVRPVGKIGVAYDGTPVHDFSRFDFLLQFAGLFNARIDIFHIRKTDAPETTSTQHDGIQQLEAYLGRFLQASYQIDDQDVEEGIDKAIVENKIDILTMMPRSKPLFEKLFSGSMTRKVLYRINTGLLVLPDVTKE